MRGILPAWGPVFLRQRPTFAHLLVREWPRILGHLQKGAALEWVTVSQFSVAGPCRGILCMIGESTWASHPAEAADASAAAVSCDPQ